jgi:uncharacterized Zn finger protein
MSREDVRAKARRILSEGRVTIKRVDSAGIVALVRGDAEAFYVVTHDGARWRCSCAAIGRCSHGLAVQMVAPTGAWAQPDLFSVGGVSS